jgi:ABC-type antimicrobial peptide transport system permease subunit
MPLMYPVKHVFRNWKLFTALLIGIALAATFFAAIGIKANLAAEQSLDKQLSSVITDIEFQASLNSSNLGLAYKNVTNIDGVKQVDMIARFYSPVGVPSDNYTNLLYTQMACFPNTSRIYNEWTNKPEGGIPENYTYIIADTNLAQRVSIGDNITTMITFPTPKYYNSTTIYLNLTVAGFAQLTDNGYAYVSGNNYYVFDSRVSGVPTSSSSYGGYRGDLMIISWENTLQKLWNTTLDSSTVDITFSVNVDHQKLISPWNIQASVNNVNEISDNIQNQILANYLSHGSVNNMLSNTLSGFQNNFQSMIINFFIVSTPIFFVAWYLGSTVSDVSFNIRRREIGLLSTKGLSSGQIQRMFLTEALIIGSIGGALGVVGGLILNQYYAGTVDLNNLFNSQMFSPQIMVVTIVFGVILSLTSVFWSSRKASRIPAVDALRDYMPTDKPGRKIFPIIALILGSYKIVVFALGLSMQQLVYQWSYSYGNILLSFVSGGLVLFDTVMTYIGPFLFFWGLTKILIRDSTKFQQLASKISSVMGDLGALAAKNVRRNPARLASVAFLIALIIGLSVQVTGQIASQQDYIVRNVHSSVGADITINVVNSSKGQLIYNDILANVSGIRNASIECSLSEPLSDKYGSITIKTIDPYSWAASAYYEQGWFSGTSVDQMLKDLKGSNNTIILERSVAKQLNLKLYDEIGIDFSSSPRKLRIIGFFGPEPQDNNGGPIYINKGFSQPTYVYSQFYSYVPRDLFNMTYGSGIYNLESFTTKILIALNPGVNGTQIANQIRNLNLEIYGVDSFDEQWQSSVEMNNLNTYSSLQVLDVQSFGLVFAVLSASVGTALIAIVSLKDRSREATLMSVRGLSYRQLVWMFLTESMAIITFAVILGICVGVIIVYGNVTATHAYNLGLVTQRLIFPADVIVTIGTYVALIYASTIGAIIVMTSQYVTKLEKMVRSK